MLTIGGSVFGDSVSNRHRNGQRVRRSWLRHGLKLVAALFGGTGAFLYAVAVSAT